MPVSPPPRPLDSAEHSRRCSNRNFKNPSAAVFYLCFIRGSMHLNFLSHGWNTEQTRIKKAAGDRATRTPGLGPLGQNGPRATFFLGASRRDGSENDCSTFEGDSQVNDPLCGVIAATSCDLLTDPAHGGYAGGRIWWAAGERGAIPSPTRLGLESSASESLPHYLQEEGGVRANNETIGVHTRGTSGGHRHHRDTDRPAACQPSTLRGNPAGGHSAATTRNNWAWPCWPIRKRWAHSRPGPVFRKANKHRGPP